MKPEQYQPIEIRLSFFASEPIEPHRDAKAKMDLLVSHGSTMFEHIHLLTRLYEEDKITEIEYLSINYTLSALGAAVVDAIQTTYLKQDFLGEAKDEN